MLYATRASPPAPREILEKARGLLEATESLHGLAGPGGKDPRDGVLLLLRSKVIPELEAELTLPVFVGIQGGTNTGKSTVFNALSGKILSPVLAVASATKHPLVFAHERWRGRFLSGAAFPGVECRELGDAKDLIAEPDLLDRLYFRFHNDPRLDGLALIDSPDFDSTLVSNAVKAARIAAISDVTIFVTTAEKYRDRVLVAELEKLLGLKGEVLLIFNKVDEEIVFQTLLDDLRQALPAESGRIDALRLPTSPARHPEEALQLPLSGALTDRLSKLRPDELKPAIVARSVRRAVVLAEELIESYSGETAVKKEAGRLIEERARELEAEYAARFRLSFPEETLAIRRVLALTELAPRFELGRQAARSSRALEAAAGLFRRANEVVRKVIARLLPSHEGSVEPVPGAITEYARARNVADAEEVSRLVERLRVKAEGFLRKREKSSSFAAEVLRDFFTPELSAGLAGRVTEAHGAALKTARGSGEEVLRDVEGWIASRPRTVRGIGLLAVAFKIGMGLWLAWVLPPALGLLAFLHPLKWLYFAAGYLIAAYAIALVACFCVRRRKRFERARREAMAAALRTSFLAPLEAVMDSVLLEDRVEKVARLAGEIARHPALAALERPEHPVSPATGR
jgi:hypothetical protein